MNPLQILDLIPTVLSYRREIYTICLIFLGILLIPLLSIIVITNAGFQPISDVLVKIDPITKSTQLLNPDGTLYKAVNLKTIWPVKGVITLGFGESDLPYQPFHTGIDIANPNGKIGDPVIAFMPGKVVTVTRLNWGYGNYVMIDHGDNITSLYGHLDKIYVNQGQEVKQGQVIGTEGETGWATGPHLHFEVRVFGIPINPKAFLGS